MEPERNEIYERIPWETLEKKGSDRQWLLYGVAGAVVLGGLAYSFMRNQPAPVAPLEAVATTSAPATIPTTVSPAAPPPTVAAPMVVAEADLFAVDPELIAGQAAAHAERFAVEFISFDGSDESELSLAGLLPTGVPLPDAPEGTQVFVDWAGASDISEVAPGTFQVEVVVRSLVATGDGGFSRQPARIVTVMVAVDGESGPRLAGLPSIGLAEPASPPAVTVDELPADLAAALDPSQGEPVGATTEPDGTVRAVVMAEGSDGVRRPVIVP